MPEYVLAFDVEKVGCGLTDPCFATGAALVEVKTCDVKETFLRFNFNADFCTFEPRCARFWDENSEVLEKMTVHHDSFADYEEAQRKMILDTFQFIEDKQRAFGAELLLVTDTAGFDHESLNAALWEVKGTDDFMPLPYWNGMKRPWAEEDALRAQTIADARKWRLRDQSVVAPFGVFRSTTSMLQGFLMGRGIMMADSKPWAVKKVFLDSFPEIGRPPVAHTHMPDDDAVGVAWTIAKMIGMCAPPSVRPAIAFTHPTELHKELKSKDLHPECGLALIATELRKSLPKGFQHPPRKALHCTIVDDFEFDVCLETDEVAKPTNGDEWAAFEAPPSLRDLNLRRCAWVVAHGLQEPGVTVSLKHVEINYKVDETTRGHTTIAYWKEGVPEPEKVYALVEDTVKDLASRFDLTKGSF